MNRNRLRWLAFGIAIAGCATAIAARPAPQTAPQASTAPQWQWPDRMKNAKVLSPETGGQALRGIMRGFTSALGVRCTHCHVGTEQMSLSEIDFASDANPRKETARAMMRMTGQLNHKDLPAIPGVTDAKVTCYTCHRGAKEPATAPDDAPAS